MATSTRPSDSAGSHARTRRALAVAPSAALRAPSRSGATVISVCIAERGLNDLLLRHVTAVQMGNDPAISKHIDAVAIVELVDFAGVPKEGAAVARLLAEEVVHLQLGADIDTAHRIVHQNNPRVGAQRSSEQHLLLIAAREREDVVIHVRRADVDPLLPDAREFGLAAR